MPDEAGSILDEYRASELPRQVDRIRRALGDGAEVEVDWASFAGQETAARELRYGGLGRVADALSLLALTRENREPLAQGIRRVALRNVARVEERSVALAGGVLRVAAALGVLGGDISEGDVRDAVTAALDLDTAPIRKRIEADLLPRLSPEVVAALGAPVALEVDFAAFRVEPDPRRRKEALSRLERSALALLAAALRRAVETAPALRERAAAVRRIAVGPAPEGSSLSVAARPGGLVAIALPLLGAAGAALREADLATAFASALAGAGAPPVQRPPPPTPPATPPPTPPKKPPPPPPKPKPKPSPDAEIEKLLAQLREKVTAADAETKTHVRGEIPLAVDWPGFVTVPALRRLERDGIYNLGYAIRQAAGSTRESKARLKARVKGLRLEHAPRPEDREVFGRAGIVIYRIHLATDDRDGALDPVALEHLVGAVVAGLPEPPPPAAEDAAALAGRLRPMLGQTPVQAEAGGDPRLARLGLARALGAVAWLLDGGPPSKRHYRTEDDAKERLADLAAGLASIVVRPAPPGAGRDCRISAGELLLALDLDAGPARGAFDEVEIAALLSDRLRLEVDPIVRKIRRKTVGWIEERLAERFNGRAIPVDVDFAGFASDPDTHRNLFALQILPEHGPEALHYALGNLFDHDPAFTSAFGARVRGLRVESVGSPAEKGVAAEGGTIVYRCFLHEGYKGYLTIDDLEDALPGVVEGMGAAKRSAP